MRIKHVSIEGFRCLQNVDIDFDEVTTFIGPNGAGKSTILRALDWFFNANPKKSDLDESDLFGDGNTTKIVVRVDFDQLTRADRDALTEKYAPASVEVFTVWRIWENGEEKITGKALAHPPFEDVRQQESAAKRRARLEEIIEEFPDRNYPAWANDAPTQAAMLEWERTHPELLEEAEVSDTHFFGFAGSGVLSGLFDFVLVTADLRAAEESQDSKSSIIGRILEKTLDREAATEELKKLSEELAKKHSEITEKHFGAPLEELSGELSLEVAAFTSGREINVESGEVSYEAKPTSFVVRVRDGEVRTAVERQGHGFQRSLLIAALKLLADRGSSSSDPSVVCLAVEEPELFQHPTQCRAFASVLRKIATDQGSGIQVTYATHSPYFILPREFSQVRRVVRRATNQSSVHGVDVYRATEDRICQRLDGFVAEQTVRRRFDSVCVSELGEALFAEAVLVVEGPSDRGVLEGAAERTRPLSVSGVAVAACGGRDSVLIPVSILTELRIPIHVLIDADAGVADRMAGKPQDEIDDAVSNVTASNRKVLRFFGETEVDWPETWSAGDISFFPDTLETFLQSKWLACESTRNALIQDERGFADKNSATYALAARESPDDPPSELSALIDFVRALPARAPTEPIVPEEGYGESA